MNLWRIKLTIQEQFLQEKWNAYSINSLSTTLKFCKEISVSKEVKLNISCWKDTQSDHHILIGWTQNSSVTDVQTFRAAHCDTDNYLVVSEVKERLAVSKRAGI
jgi:hypothetical protein